MKKRNICMTVAVLLAVISSACIHKSSGTVTPMERVTTDNALLAQSINSLEQGTEAVTSSGLLKPDQAAPVIAWCGKAAQIDTEITAILGKSSTVSASDYTTLQDLVGQVSASANELVTSTALGVKNPKTQQTIAADITAATHLAQALLTEIQALTGGK